MTRQAKQTKLTKVDETKIRVGVVGVGHVGQYHANKYAASNKAKLVGVVDIDQNRRPEGGRTLGVDCATYTSTGRTRFPVKCEQYMRRTYKPVFVRCIELGCVSQT